MLLSVRLILIVIVACSACKKSKNKETKQFVHAEQGVKPQNQNSSIVYLDGDLIPQNQNSSHYKNIQPIKSIISDFIKRSEKQFPADRQHVNKMNALNGSSTYAIQGGGDYGFFTAIFHAYNNHWALKTVPDDWWYTIIRTVAIAIDKNSKKDEVRNFFVAHQGKKRLVVDVDRSRGIDYAKFFRDMTNLVQSNIKVEGYVETIRSDFSTSTPTHRIVSEITIMSSMQEFFEYAMRFTCGIPYVDLHGTKADWSQLKTKFLKLKQMLKPIERQIGLNDWWARVETICDKLIGSRNGNGDKNWWTNIFRVTKDNNFGSGGPDVTYDGWFLRDLLNIKTSSIESLGSLPSGLVSVPLLFILEDGSNVKGAIASGIAGIKLNAAKDVPVVESTHGWAIFAERNIRI